MPPSATRPRHPWREILRILVSARMWITLALGFSSGLPLLLTGSVLQAWMQQERLDLGTIGLFALVGLPYTLKFLWAPILDRYTWPVLGRRRGWLLAAQGGLILALTTLAFSRPAQAPMGLALAALAVSFFSASQDIVVDAYRREALADDELGLGASLYVNGYRVGMLLASGGGLILADFIPFRGVYLLMAGFMLMGVLTTLAAPEPKPSAGRPQTLLEAVWHPFVDYFRRRDALAILAFILLYKIGDTMASHLSTVFYLDLGFSKTEIGTVVKLFGFWAVLGGGFLGGLWILRLGIQRALLWFGVLQGVSTAGFAVLALLGDNLPGLAAVVAFENLTGGMGTAAFVAFMAALTNRRFTATQYALLSSFMGVPRVILAAPTGYLAEASGWPGFFLICALLALPGLVLLRWLQGRGLTDGESIP